MTKIVHWLSFIVVCSWLFISCSGDSDGTSTLPLVRVAVEDQIESVTLYDGGLEDGKIIAKIFTSTGDASHAVLVPAGHLFTILTSEAPTGTLYSSSRTIDKTTNVLVKNDYSIRWMDSTD